MSVQQQATMGVFGRLLWILVGPACMLVSLAVVISSPGQGWKTTADFIFWLALLGAIFGRWLEFHSGDPRTSTGQPATVAHLRRYAIVAALVGGGAWVAVNYLSNVVLI